MTKQIAKNPHPVSHPVAAKHPVKQSAKAQHKVKWEFPLNKRNFVILAIGVGVIIFGYLLMATGITDQPAVPDGKWNNVFAVQIAPVVLVIGYCVIIPYSIMKFFGGQKDDTQQQQQQ